MPRIRLTLEYDGTDFAGWQTQPGQRTVQDTVEAVVTDLLESESPVAVRSASRTDAGVHALAQVVAFDTERSLPPEAYVKGLNALLPDDVAVTHASPAADDFDPRRDASGKRYVYQLWNGPTRAPLRSRRQWQVFWPIDPAAMRAAAAHLEGEHDFASFRAHGCAANTTVRRLDRIAIEGDAGGEIRFVIEGTAFLRKMVRIIVGTLVEVGRGERGVDEVKSILAARDRAAAGRTAAAAGLTLEAVYYGPRDGDQG